MTYRRISARSGYGLEPSPASPTVPADWYFCWGIDQEEWWRTNRIPLGQERENRWLLAITGAAMSEEQARQHVQFLFSTYWFGEYLGAGGNLGHAEIQEIEVLPERTRRAAVEALRGKLGNPIKTVDSITPPLTWAESDPPMEPIHVLVRFIYRGSNTTHPWVTYRGGTGVMNYPNAFCPKDVTVAAVAIFQPGKDKTKEDPCSVPGASLKNPDCSPLKPTNWPWWAWVAGAGVVAYFGWPYLAPVISRASAARKRAQRAADSDDEQGDR